MAREQKQLRHENLVAERIVLGKVLQSETAFWTIADSLKAFHFARPIHNAIYQAITDTLVAGRKLSLAVIESRIGPEYDDDGKSTSSLLTALLRDAENHESGLEEAETIIDQWRLRKIIETLESGLKAAKKPEAQSHDLLMALEQQVQDIGVNSQAEPLKSLGDIAQRSISFSSRARASGVTRGFDTGLSTLDEILGRIHTGDLGFIGAKPGDGKTVLGFQIAERAQLFGPAIYFQLEMRDTDMANRVLAGKTNVSVADIEAGAYDFEAAEELKIAADNLKASKIYIDDRAKLAIEQIRDRCVAMKRSKGLVLGVIDHVRLVRVFAKMRDKFERIEHVTGELKAIAKDLDMAFVCLSQITRAAQRRDEPSPQLNDFDGGSSIEQDADWALGMFRRDRWWKTQRPQDMESSEGRKWAETYSNCKGKIEITCLKRRRGEDGEMREFVFNGRRGRIEEVER